MKKMVLLFVLALLLPKAETAGKEFYVIVSNDGKTMTFYYDNFRQHRAGTCYYDREGWKAAAETVTQVYFDESLSCDTFDVYRPESTERWFYQFKKLRYVNHLENLNTRQVTSMRSMFYECESLQQLDVSKLYTGNVTTMRCMFFHCSSLTSIDVTHFVMRKVENAIEMFCGCSQLTTLDLSTWDLSNAVDIKHLFMNCSNLKTIYVEYGADWRNYQKIQSHEKMFYGCTKLVGGNGTTYDSSLTGIGQALHDNNLHSGYFSAYDYPTIGGERITREGQQNFSCIKSGTVTYSKMGGLTLNNAVISTTTDKGGISFTEGGYITLVGINSIDCGRDGIHVTGGDFFIDGGGQLSIKSNNGYGISFSDMFEVSALEGPTRLDIEGYHGALDGQKHYSTYYEEDRCGYMNNYRATLTLRSGGGDYPVIHDLSSMQGEDGDWFYSYLHYRFDKDKGTVVDTYYDEPITNPFSLLPEEPETYGIYLGGHLINEANKDDFRPQALSSGQVRYNSRTQTLYMDNARFDRLYYPIDDGTALSSDALADFTIELTGENTLIGKNEDGYDHTISIGNWQTNGQQGECHYTIRSANPDEPASLHFGSQLAFEFSKANAKVNIENVDLINEGSWAAFWGYSTENGKVYLTVDNSAIDLGEESIGGDMNGFYTVTLKDCSFANGFYYDTNTRQAVDRNGENGTGPVRIVRDGGATGIENASWNAEEVNSKSVNSK